MTAPTEWQRVEPDNEHPERYGCRVALPGGEAATRQAVRTLDLAINRRIRDRPGTVLERRDAYLVLDGPDGPGVWIRSDVTIQPVTG